MPNEEVNCICSLFTSLHLHMNPMLPAGLLTLTTCYHSSDVCVIPYVIVLLINRRFGT
jgi:hypothetical protein